MGTSWRIHHGGGVSGEDAQAVADLVGADERRWSRFLPQSDVSRINRGSGSPVEVTAETVELVAAAVDWSRRSGGAFQPLIGGRVAAWGYRQGLGDTAGAPAPGAVPDASAIALDDDRRTIAVPAGAELDLGGIGKSWSAVRAGALLADRTDDQRLIIDAGGDLAIVRGTQAIETAAGRIPAAPGEGVATSSSERRRWAVPSAGEAHHLIDPVTGAPGDRGTAVVAGVHPVAADVLASCLVLRPDLLDAIDAPAARIAIDGSMRTNARWRSVTAVG